MLKQLRMQIGLTQKQMADALGVSQSTITHIENGIRQPSLSLGRRIVRLMKAYQLNLTLDDIYADPTREVA